MTIEAHALDGELATYDRHREELLGRASGKFVLIHGDQVVAVFETEWDAVSAGYKAFGNVPFLVKEIVAVEVPQDFVSNQLAV